MFNVKNWVQETQLLANISNKDTPPRETPDFCFYLRRGSRHDRIVAQEMPARRLSRYFQYLHAQISGTRSPSSGCTSPPAGPVVWIHL